MNMHIAKRPLRNEEIDCLIKETKRFPNLTYVSKKRWQNYKKLYVIQSDEEFAGVCVVQELPDAVKIGPLVIIEKYQGKKLGTKLLKEIIQDYHYTTIYIGSSNSILQKILRNLEFQEIRSFLHLPKEIQKHLLKTLIAYLRVDIISEVVRKKLALGRDPYRFYLKTPQQA